MSNLLSHSQTGSDLGTPGHSVPAPEAVFAGAERDRRRSLPQPPTAHEGEATFLELRRKVQAGELLSASTERLLRTTDFNGYLTVMVQHGRVIKSRYEEGYFRRSNDFGGAPQKR